MEIANIIAYTIAVLLLIGLLIVGALRKQFSFLTVIALILLLFACIGEIELSVAAQFNPQDVFTRLALETDNLIRVTLAVGVIILLSTIARRELQRKTNQG